MSFQNLFKKKFKLEFPGVDGVQRFSGEATFSYTKRENLRNLPSDSDGVRLCCKGLSYLTDNKGSHSFLAVSADELSPAQYLEHVLSHEVGDAIAAALMALYFECHPQAKAGN